MSNDWQIKLTLQAEKDLESLDASIRQRIVEKLHWLVANFSSVVSIPLNNTWKDYCKLRVGDWRVVYQPDHKLKTIIVYNVGRRDKVYKP
ncbi:MAG: type II toxin-antitoxin system RelE/ParE family toxin [Candidatus Vogelbacteria bacterium]|nr:type II toxin-antitoxin system RelE/ParE family toxin [Candidatus Vogelbacteria bacterium]